MVGEIRYIKWVIKDSFVILKDAGKELTMQSILKIRDKPESVKTGQL